VTSLDLLSFKPKCLTSGEQQYFVWVTALIAQNGWIC